MTAQLTLSSVSLSYQGVSALDEVTVQLDTGQSVGLIGPNGAGKTTLFNVVSGFVRPDSGSVRWNDDDITGSSVAARARSGLVRTFQHVQVFPTLTVAENLDIARAAARRGGRTPASADAVLDQVGLGPRRDTVASGLSYGSARTLGLGMALILAPELLMLDEPAAGLTRAEIDHLTTVVNGVRESTTLWMVEHNVEFITATCDRVLVLDAGRLIADTVPRDLAHDPRVVAAYLGES